MLRQRHIVGKSIKICGNECTPKNVKKAGLPRLKNYQSLHHIYNTKIKTSPARQSSSKNQEKIFKKCRKFTQKNRKFGNPIIGPEQECTPNQQRRQNLNIHNIGNK